MKRLVLWIRARSVGLLLSLEQLGRCGTTLARCTTSISHGVDGGERVHARTHRHCASVTLQKLCCAVIML